MSDDNTPALSMEYVLQKLDQIAGDTAYLSETIAALQDLKSDPAFADNQQGDNAGEAKAKALGSAIMCRETTNQQLIALYARMYQDLQSPSMNEDTRKMEQLRHVTEIFKDAETRTIPFLKTIAEKLLGLPSEDD